MADFVVPSFRDFPKHDRYTVVYDAEYVGFEPGKGSVVGQTVSVLNPELRSDDVFAIREQRTFGNHDERDRNTEVRLLSRGEFLGLARAGFPKDTVVGETLGRAFSFQHMTSVSDSLTTSWPSVPDAYAKAIVCGLGASGKFGNLDLAVVNKAMDASAAIGKELMRWNDGPGRGAIYTCDDFMSREEQVDCGIAPNGGIPRLVGTLSNSYRNELIERAESHRQVHVDHPVTLLNQIVPISRAVTIVPFTSSLDSFTVSAPKPTQASPADVMIDIDDSSTYDSIRVPLKKGSDQLDI